MKMNCKKLAVKKSLLLGIFMPLFSLFLSSCSIVNDATPAKRPNSGTISGTIQNQLTKRVTDKPVQRVYTIAMVGDSITYDSGDNNEFAWLHRLRNKLGDKFVIHNFGVNGATALKQSNKPYWQQPELSAAITLQPDAVFIMLGTNDSKTENWRNGNNHFQVDYLNLIAQFSSLPNRPKIWLGQNLPAFSDGWTINGKIIEDDILATVKLISNMTKIDLVDLRTPFLNRPDLFSDGIHPNWEGGNELVKAVSFAIETHCIKTHCNGNRETHER